MGNLVEHGFVLVLQLVEQYLKYSANFQTFSREKWENILKDENVLEKLLSDLAKSVEFPCQKKGKDLTAAPGLLHHGRELLKLIDKGFTGWCLEI